MKFYEFDFDKAIGDTIKEKYESFYVLIDEINDISSIRFCFGPHHIIALFEISDNKKSLTKSIKAGCMEYTGSLDNGKLKFQLFSTGQSAKDELILCSEHGNTFIKFLNYVV
jgi:hypothetical protein